MGYLKEMRISLGLTQNEIALMLDVSRSRYAMTESGRRSCPDHWPQLFKDLRAQAAEEEKDEKSPSKVELASDEQKVSAEVQRMINYCKYQILNKNYQLNIMREKNQKLMREYDLLDNELRVFGNTERTAQPLSKIKKRVAKAMKATSPLRQKMLDIEIRNISQRLHDYEMLLQEMEGKK